MDPRISHLSEQNNVHSTSGWKKKDLVLEVAPLGFAKFWYDVPIPLIIKIDRPVEWSNLGPF